MTARNSYGYEVASYDSESLLQELLVKHIVLLLGGQINSGEPRRWLLITRGLSVLDRQGGFVRWSLDHLLLDQDTAPTTQRLRQPNERCVPNQSPYDARFASSGSTDGHGADDAKKTITLMIYVFNACFRVAANS
jgi:hypothetical protein